MRIIKSNYPLGIFLLLFLLTISCDDNDKAIPKPTGQVTDVDGNVYPTISIGTQTWMVENLRTTKLNDGSPIDLVEDNAAWSGLSTPAYSWYNNDEVTYKNAYGALYNVFAVNTDKLCPDGWHVPSDAEWTILTDILGGEVNGGGKLKEKGTVHWNSPNTGATNERGFTGLPGGYRGSNGGFFKEGENGYWWSTTEYDAIYTTNRYLQFDKADVFRHYGNNIGGHSVRCISD